MSWSFASAGSEDASTQVVAPPRGLANELQPVAIQMRDASDPKRAEAAKSEFVQLGEATRLVGTLRYADGRAASFVPVRVGERTAVTE